MPKPKPTNTPASKPARSERYERFELSFRGVMAFLVALAFGAMIMHAALWDWWRNIGGGRKITAAHWSPASEQRPELFRNAPPLQLAPQDDWQTYRRTEDAALHSYGWVDKTNGIVRVPIEVAIQQILARGLPIWPGTNQNLSPLQLQWQRAGNRNGPAT